MKDILILLFVLFFPMIVNAQDKSSFSFREVNHIRVATPGLFAKGNHIYLHLVLRKLSILFFRVINGT